LARGRHVDLLTRWPGAVGTMHLLFINSIFPQPSQTFVLDQIRYARELRLRVTILCKRYNPALLMEQAADLAGLVIHDRPRNGAMSGRLARGLIRHPGQFGAFIRNRRALGLHASDLVCALQIDRAPDVIVANFGQNGIVAARIKQAFFPGARLAVIFHGYDLSAYVATYGWDGYRRAAPAIDIAIAVNRPWASLLAANAALRAIAIHHLGVDLARIPQRDRTGPGGRFSVLFVGRMVEKKGLRVLLAAIAALRARGRDLEVQAIGDGPEESALRAEASAAGLDGSITFHGSQPHDFVLEMMNRCDCLALPSVTAANGDQEGIPVTLMEAMASGLPVVSTYHSGIPELVTDDETGLLVPERDAGALADALDRLMSEKDLGDRLAASARRFVAAEFNASIQNRKLFDLILGRAGAPTIS
jgi:colanic acid/amylovoran biosynthesis glycosyltransferase